MLPLLRSMLTTVCRMLWKLLVENARPLMPLCFLGLAMPSLFARENVVDGARHGGHGGRLRLWALLLNLIGLF